MWRKGVRSFLCSRSARPQKGLARRPQSKAPHALAWLGIEVGEEDTNGYAQCEVIEPTRKEVEIS